MRARQIIHTIDSHTAGEGTRLVISGIPVKGRTILEKLAYLRENLDWMRSALMNEPRGFRGMFGGVLVPPSDDSIDYGVIWMDNGGYLNMSGASSIGVGVTLVEAGLVPVTEPLTRIRLEVPAGVVEVDVTVKDGRALSAAVRNVPAFLYARDLLIDVEGYGTVPVDISFGGNFFGVVKAEDLGLEVRPELAGELAKVGVALRHAINRETKVVHPVRSHISSVDLVTIYGLPTVPGAKYKCTHVFADGQFDRSPGGTGTSHMMALLLARDQMQPDEEIVAEGILGSVFHGRIVGREKVGEFDAVIPEIRSDAYLTGFHQFVVDPDDPFAEGFLVG